MFSDLNWALPCVPVVCRGVFSVWVCVGGRPPLKVSLSLLQPHIFCLMRSSIAFPRPYHVYNLLSISIVLPRKVTLSVTGRLSFTCSSRSHYAYLHTPSHWSDLVASFSSLVWYWWIFSLVGFLVLASLRPTKRKPVWCNHDCSCEDNVTLT